MSEPQWYLSDGQWRRGPMTLDELLGNLQPPDVIDRMLVWRPGLAQWAHVRDVPELAARVRGPAAPFPPPLPSPDATRQVAVAPEPSPPPAPAPAAPAAVTPAASVDARPEPWFMVGTLKLALMSMLTLGLYEVYWFYSHWRRVRDSGELIWPVPRALFAPLFFPGLYKRLHEAAAAAEMPTSGSVVGPCLAFFVLTACWRLPDPYWLISLLSWVPLVGFQTIANRLMAGHSPPADPNTRLSPANWVGMAVGGLVLLLALWGMLVPITSRPYLSIVAAVANRDLPKVLDDETEMMSVTPLDGVLVYRYRLIKRLAADLDGTAFARTIRPILIKGACADAELRETLLKPGVKLRHVYGDQRGMDVATIEVAWADCGLTR